MKVLFILLCLSSTLTLAKASNLSYFLKFKKINSIDTSIDSCLKLKETVDCTNLRNIANFEPNYYPNWRKALIPAALVVDVLVIGFSTELIRLNEPISILSQMAGVSWGLSHIEILNPKFQWKKANLTGELNKLNLKNIGDEKIIFYYSADELNYAEDIILDL